MSGQYNFTRMLRISIFFTLAIFLQACGQNDSGSAAKKASQAVPGVGASAEVAAVDAEQLYKGACQACHLAGVANAPKLDDRAAWAPRIATGIDALIKSAINGKNAMPPKGGRLDYSDDQIGAIVKYMVSQAQ